MHVSAICTRDPHTLGPEATLDEAMNLIDLHEIRHLPVVSDGRLVGIVSHRDLLEATGWFRNSIWHATGPNAPRHLAAIQRGPPVTVAPDDSVVTAALEMSLRRIGCLVVLEHGRLFGIVTETDLARAFVSLVEAGRAAAGADPEVRALMTTNAMTVQVSTTLQEATELARTTGVRHLPVADGERLVGMLSDRDLRRCRGEYRDPATPAGAIMTRDPVGVDVAQRVSAAARVLLGRRISALPVLQDGRLVGILTLTDLLDHCMGTLREAG